MIYTLTVNPSLDYMIQVPQFETGIVNRSSSEKIIAGGKGINVSLMLKNLGVENCALGFVAGFTGMEIESVRKGLYAAKHHRQCKKKRFFHTC